RPVALGVDETANKIYVGNSSVINTTANPATFTAGGITVIDGNNNFAATQVGFGSIPVATTIPTPPPGSASVANGGMVPNPATGKVYFRLAGSTASLGVLSGTTVSTVPAITGTVAFNGVGALSTLNRVYVFTTAIFNQFGTL